jgi:hypothetical protein
LCCSSCLKKVENLPRLFGKSVLFGKYPYLLPCLVAACIIASGAFLSLFLSYDGGPRGRAIHLPEKDEDDLEADTESSFRDRLVTRVSGIFSRPPLSRNASLMENASPRPLNGLDRNTLAISRTTTRNAPERNPLALSRSTTRNSGVVGYGSAYGYDSRPRYPSIRRPSKGWRSLSGVSTQYAPDFEQDENDRQNGLGFAQR